MSIPASPPELRPLGIGEILDAAIKVYKEGAGTLMRLTAVVVIPLQVLNAVVLASTLNTVDEVRSSNSSFSFSAGTNGAGGHASLGGQFLTTVIGVVVGALTTAACFRAVSDLYLGRAAQFGTSMRFAVRRLGPLLWLQIMLFGLVGLATLALILPGVWLYVSWALATPALLFEDVRGPRALGRSFRLVRHRWWPTFAVLVVTVLAIGIITGLIAGILTGIAAASSQSVTFTVIVLSLATAVASIVTRPFQAAVVAVLYFDVRVRKEGFELSLLADRLGLPEHGAAAPPPAGIPGTGPAPDPWNAPR